MADAVAASTGSDAVAVATPTELLRNPMEVRTELRSYYTKVHNKEEDVLKWWRDQKKQLPGLSKLAMRYYCIPATSSSVERAFSKAGIVVSALRSCLSSASVQQLVWLRLNWSDELLEVDYHEKEGEGDEEKKEADTEDGAEEKEEDAIDEDDEDDEESVTDLTAAADNQIDLSLLEEAL